MSIELVNYVWNNSEHSGSSLLVMLAIADYANDDGRAWPSIDTLCKKTRLSVRQTHRIIKKLEESGEIEVEHIRNKGNVYTVKVISDKMSLIESVYDTGDIFEEPISDTGDTKLYALSDKMSHDVNKSTSNKLTSNKLTKLPTTDKEKEIEAYLKTVPHQTIALADAFCHMHGRPPTQNEDKYWRKCWYEQERIGLNPEHIIEAYHYMDKHNLTVKSPQSLNAVAERIKREGRDTFLDPNTEMVELGDVRYAVPKSKKPVQ